MATLEKVHVVEDHYEKFPQFHNMFYCGLDYELVLIYIMVFFLFEEVVGANSLLSLFFVYLLERTFYNIRKMLGHDNLSQKSSIDKNFFS